MIPNALGAPRSYDQELGAQPLRTRKTAVLETEAPDSPVKGVKWSFGYLTFLFYILVVTTYRIPAGTEAMVLALVALPFQSGRLRVPPLLALLGAFIVWCALGYLTSAYQDTVWDAVLDDGKIWLIAFVTVNALRTRPQLRFFLLFFLACFALYPVRGAIFNYFIYNERLLGRAHWNFIYSNPNDLAAFCLLQLSIAAGLLVTEPKGWTRRAALAGIGVLPFLILLTQSRGAIIALAVFSLFAFASQRVKLRRVLLALVLGLGVVVAAPSSVWTRMQGLRNATDTSNLSAVDADGSAEQRYEIWRVASRIIADHPISGVGRGAYKFAHQAYATRSEFKPIALGYRDTHSTYFNLLAETGVVGFLLFAALVIVTLADARRTRRRCRRLFPRAALQLKFLELGLATYLIAAVFGSVSHLVFTHVHLAIVCGASQVLKQERRKFLSSAA